MKRCIPLIRLLRQVEEETNQTKWGRGSGSDFNSNQLFREKVSAFTFRLPFLSRNTTIVWGGMYVHVIADPHRTHSDYEYYTILIAYLELRGCSVMTRSTCWPRHYRRVYRIITYMFNHGTLPCRTHDVEQVRRHEFIARGPRERYSRTVTAVQEHGWHDQLEVNRQVSGLLDPPSKCSALPGEASSTSQI